MPDLLQVAKDCERFGADGVTVHPRPDERHIRYADVYELAPVLNTEFNIEGYPNEKFLKMVLDVKPDQCTLVPDPPGVLTSNAGWDTIKHKHLLEEVVKALHNEGIRTSLFMEPNRESIAGSAAVGADRIEFYTGPYAKAYAQGKRDQAVRSFIDAANWATECGLAINAGHDLNLTNLHYFVSQVPNVLEVSIGHALISDALYFGLHNTIQLYQKQLEVSQTV